jgi:hypothetical protein
VRDRVTNRNIGGRRHDIVGGRFACHVGKKGTFLNNKVPEQAPADNPHQLACAARQSNRLTRRAGVPIVAVASICAKSARASETLFSLVLQPFGASRARFGSLSGQLTM